MELPLDVQDNLTEMVNAIVKDSIAGEGRELYRGVYAAVICGEWDHDAAHGLAREAYESYCAHFASVAEGVASIVDQIIKRVPQ